MRTLIVLLQRLLLNFIIRAGSFIEIKLLSIIYAFVFKDQGEEEGAEVSFSTSVSKVLK